eukprot:9085320-Heterocapsa_arctica.AAC.1
MLMSRASMPLLGRSASGSRRSRLQHVHLDHLLDCRRHSLLHVAAQLVEVELLGPKLARRRR